MKTSKSKPNINGRAYRIAIILARYNDELGHELMENTKASLMQNGVLEKMIDVYRVPGALELPLAAKAIANQKMHQAIIALGIVIRGETAHFDHVSKESHRGLMSVQLEKKIPIIFGVLTVNDIDQAKARVNKDQLNKGDEYSTAALEMAQFMEKME